MTEGLLDTSAVVDLHRIDASDLPDRCLLSTLTMAELVQGPVFASDEETRRARSRLVLDVRLAFPETLPFDDDCVSAYQSVAAMTVAAGRGTRRRTLDLMIAATAHAHGLPLHTRNSADVEHLGDLLEIIAI